MKMNKNLEVRTKPFRGSKKIVVNNESYYVKSSGRGDKEIIDYLKNMYSPETKSQINNLQTKIIIN